MASFIKHGLEESCKLAPMKFTIDVFQIYIISDSQYHVSSQLSCLKTDDTIILIIIKEPTQIKSFPKILDWGGSANLLRQSVIYEQKKVYTIGRRSRER